MVNNWSLIQVMSCSLYWASEILLLFIRPSLPLTLSLGWSYGLSHGVQYVQVSRGYVTSAISVSFLVLFLLLFFDARVHIKSPYTPCRSWLVLWCDRKNYLKKKKKRPAHLCTHNALLVYFYSLYKRYRWHLHCTHFWNDLPDYFFVCRKNMAFAKGVFRLSLSAASFAFGAWCFCDVF